MVVGSLSGGTCSRDGWRDRERPQFHATVGPFSPHRPGILPFSFEPQEEQHNCSCPYGYNPRTETSHLKNDFSFKKWFISLQQLYWPRQVASSHRQQLMLVSSSFLYLQILCIPLMNIYHRKYVRHCWDEIGMVWYHSITSTCLM